MRLRCSARTGLSGGSSDGGGSGGGGVAGIMQGTPALGAGRALDRIFSDDPGGTIAALFMPLTTEQQVTDAVNQTLPLMTGATISAAQNIMGGINRVIQSRIESNRLQTSGSSGSDDAFFGDRHIWMKPFGSWARQSAQDGAAGFDADTYGLAFGVDGARTDTLRFGAAFIYANSNVNSKSVAAPQSADVDAYQLVGYGSLDLDDRTSLDFQADIGHNRNNGRRSISFASSVASSSYSSRTAHAGVRIGRRYFLNEQTSVTPSLHADYSWIKDDGYTETGAGALSLNVGSRSTRQFILGADSKLTYQIDSRNTLSVDLGVGYDTIHKRDAIVAAYAGAPDAAFATYGVSPSPWVVTGGLGWMIEVRQGVEITGRYDIEHRTGFLNQSASVKVRWSF